MPHEIDWTTPENARFMALGYKPVTHIGINLNRLGASVGGLYIKSPPAGTD
jgi:hypothetical protein